MSDDFVLVNGTLVSRRWVNEDGTRKTGEELRRAIIQVELEDIARRVLRISKEL